MRLLLVEDEEDLAIAIQKILRSYNCVGDWMGDGELALESLQMFDLYQLIVLDWMMPKFFGLDLCQ